MEDISPRVVGHLRVWEHSTIYWRWSKKDGIFVNCTVKVLKRLKFSSRTSKCGTEKVL